MQHKTVTGDAQHKTMSNTWQKIKERAALRRSARENIIDAHGLAGDGLLGRHGTCSICKRQNKVVGPLTARPGTERCIVPSKYRILMDAGKAEAMTGCEIQRGPRPNEAKANYSRGDIGIVPKTREEADRKRKRRKMQKASRRKNRARR
jgi:hypothetical protein